MSSSKKINNKILKANSDRFLSVRAAMAKLHRVTVTKAELDYVGSITIPGYLLDASGIQPFQMVHINNIRNGMHWETYVLRGEEGSDDICLNGPPAHHFKPSDIVIVVAYGDMKPADLKKHAPVVVFVDDKRPLQNSGDITELGLRNRITGIKSHSEIPLGSTGLPAEVFAKRSK
jgi:aspartate 1-decarboxylase